jgi:hypothetical protein
VGKKLDLRRPFRGVGGSFAIESTVRSANDFRELGVAGAVPPGSADASTSTS